MRFLAKFVSERFILFAVPARIWKIINSFNTFLTRFLGKSFGFGTEIDRFSAKFFKMINFYKENRTWSNSTCSQPTSILYPWGFLKLILIWFCVYFENLMASLMKSIQEIFKTKAKLGELDWKMIIEVYQSWQKTYFEV